MYVASPQYNEYQYVHLAVQRGIIMQFTGCQQPVQPSQSPENAIDWLGK